MAVPLTDRQRQVLEHIATSIRRSGIVPSVREIGSALGMRSPSTVHQHLTALQRKGYIKRAGDRMRVLEVLDRRMVGWQDDNCFLLTVRGDSMINVGIQPGDLVIVRSQPAAEAGEIVVALLGEEATVKRLLYEGGRPYLKPENPQYAPIFEEFEIIGKVVGLMRRYAGGQA